jgi:tetratricopeptide (TPR) repeat protein
LDQLLEGLWVGFDFFGNNNLSVEMEPPLLALQIEANGQIQLFKCQEHALVEQLIAEFNACFEVQLESPVAYERALKPLLEQKQWTEAEALLQKQLEQFPHNQRLAFVNLGELYFVQEQYQKAMEAYMKAVMLGTPKHQVKTQVQTACNALARTATDKKVAARWRQVLIDFF